MKMKKFLVMCLAALLVLSITACGTAAGGSQPSDITSSSQTEEDSSSNSDSDSDSSEIVPEMITGTLYAPFSQNDVLEVDFNYEEGTCTPESIADALTEWTGLVFDISSSMEGDIVMVDWKSSSSFAEGEPPAPQKEGFEFYDQETMRWFMLNSLCSSIQANMEASDVFYSIEGGDLNDLGLDQDFNPAVAYNRISNSNVVVIFGGEG